MLNQNQTYRVHRHRPRDYGTDVYVRLTERFIRGAAHDHQPFFAYLSVYAPHQPATPAPADVAKFPLAQAPRTPQLRPGRREPHAALRARPAPVHHGRDQCDRRPLPHAASGRCKPSTGAWRVSCDTLRATKQLDNTYIVFASDNGFHLGQHRMPAGKQTAYEHRHPRAPAGSRARACGRART